MAGIRKRRDRPGWLVDYFDSSGVRRRLEAPTREAAEDKLAEKIKESRQAAPPTPSDPTITLNAYADQWLEQMAISLEPKTVASYTEILRLYLRPALGGLKVRAIHRQHIKALLTRKLADGFSKNTVRLIRATLSVMLGDAVDEGLLVSNPVFGIARRGRRRADAISQAERQRQIRPMSHEQLATFLSVTHRRHLVTRHHRSLGAPLTYVSAQRGHHKPTTTLAFYAHWIPRGDKEWIDRLSSERLAAPLLRVPGGAVPTTLWHHVGTADAKTLGDAMQVREVDGSPGWARTSDFLINSQALYQLSYRGTR